MADWKDVGDNDGWADVGWEDVGNDPVRQIPGMEHSVDPHISKYKDESSFLDKARGVIEAGAAAVTGIPATIAEAGGQLLFGTKPGAVSDEFYHPRTEKGQEYTEAVGEFANRYLNPLMGGIGHATFPGKRVRNASEAKASVALDEIKRKQAEIDAKEGKASDPTNPDFNLPELHDEALVRRLTKLDEGLNSGRIKPFDKEAVAADKAQTAAMMARMTDKELMDNLKALDEQIEAGKVDRLADKFGKEAAAQEAIFERQRELEMEVRRRTTLDFNAAERARQENAPVPGLEELRQRQQEEIAAAHEQARKLDEMRRKEEITATQFQDELSSLAHKIEQLRAQHQIELRQRALEDQVRQRASLDLNSAERGRQEQAPIPGVDQVINRANQVAEGDPRVAALNEKIPGVEERAVDAAGYGDLHAKFMEESLKRVEQNVENLKLDIADTVRKNPVGLEPTSGIRVKGLGQRGAIGRDIRGRGRQRTVVDDLKDRFGKTDTSFIPNDPNPIETIEVAKGERDSKQWKFTESGGNLAAMKRASTLVRDGVRFVQNAVKRADLHIRNNVFPTEKALRNLSRDEVVLLHNVMKQEMLQGKRFSPDALDHLTVKQKEAYAHMRHMFDDTLRIQNEAREAKGQKPITEMEAYLSSRWDGDFRRPVYEAILNRDGSPKLNEKGEIEKKLVWYIAADTKRGLEKQWEALKKDRPDLTYEESMDHVVKYYKRETDLQSVFSTLVDIIGRDDPTLKLIEEAVKEQSVNEAATFLGQEKHFKEKTGVRGFVGDRPGKQGTFDEALAMFQQQIQYAKNAYKWSEMQKAGEGLKELFADPDLAKQQPHNIKYLKEYFKNNIGYGENHSIARLEDSVRGLGFSPSMMNEAVGSSKAFFIMQKLLMNAGYFASGVLQPVNVLPHFTALWGQKVFGNPVTASVVGLLGGSSLALGHYGNLAMKSGLSRGITLDSPFYKKAFRYAEDNGVTARSLMDESPIESSFSHVKRGADLAAKISMVPPEVLGRSIAYMSFVEFLRSSGKFKGDDIALFQKAEELVNASMVDYRAGERPMAFAKLGTIGNFLNTLQTYPANWYNQWNYFGRQLSKGNPLPIMTAFAVQYAMAGAMGIPGFQDMDKLYQMVKDHVVSNSMYAKMRDHPFWNDPKVWMMQNFGESSVYGWLSDATGVGITSRIQAPGAGDMIQAPGGPIVDIAKQVGNLGSAVLNPTNSDKWAQAAMSSVPPGMQGALEQAPFMEGMGYEKRPNGDIVPQRPGNIQDHRGVYVRSPEEQKLRNFGLRSQQETVERELGYRLDKDQRIGRERGRDMIDEIYAAAKKGDKERVKELYSAYVKLTGEKISKQAWQSQIEQNYLSSMERAGKGAKRLPITDLKAYTRMKAILEEVTDEHEQGGAR